MQEIWKDIKGWEEYYKISNFGRVKSKDRLLKEKHRTYVKKGKILIQIPNSRDYLRVTLKSKSDNKEERPFVHRLVATHFLYKEKNKNCVNHIDFDYTNNYVGNLEWCTHKENMRHSIKAGRFKRTDQWLENLHKSQEKFYKEVIGTSIKTGEKIYFKSINSVKDKGFRPGDVCNCCKGKRKTHLGYTWEYGGAK